jgi:glutathione peroxidase
VLSTRYAGGSGGCRTTPPPQMGPNGGEAGRGVALSRSWHSARSVGTAGLMTKSIYDFSAKTIGGEPKSLADYKGNVLLIVNVASKCGLTPQYAGLEALHETYGAKGLKVLGFPANEFGAQEPGTNEEIEKFCTSRYGVKFDMFTKVKVKGPGIDPLFDYLTSPETNPKSAGEIKWNFNKFLVGKDGELLARFEPPIDPTSAEVKQAIEKALA